ncbi:MAG TPA: cyclophilin-like fold protein [Ktedonobacteraceae bacterium]|nr:cyclophilin-like fold protein [Ktedonobacteraceae bacterium]
MHGVPRGDDPERNDLGYYAPSQSLVLYYSDVSYWDGIVRLGRFESDIEAIRTLPDGFPVTMTRCE